MAQTGDVTLTVSSSRGTWDYPSPARVDAEYAAFLNQHGEDAIAEAREFLGDTVQAEYTTSSASSASEGLIATARSGRGAHRSRLRAARPLGRITVGGIANEMLHTSRSPWRYLRGDIVRRRVRGCAASPARSPGPRNRGAPSTPRYN